MRRQLEVEVLTDAGAVVRGFGAREVVTDLVGTPPVYATISRGWCMQTFRVGDLTAFAEMCGFDVRVIDDRDETPAPVVAPVLGLSPDARRKARLFATLTAAPAIDEADPGRARW